MSGVRTYDWLHLCAHTQDLGKQNAVYSCNGILLSNEKKGKKKKEKKKKEKKEDILTHKKHSETQKNFVRERSQKRDNIYYMIYFYMKLENRLN